jgi:hypothetical protein
MSKKETPRIDVPTLRNFEKAEGQIEGFFDEIGNLAKKKPDDGINKFKLQFINQTLVMANKILGHDYRPFPDFDKFDADDLPSNSDVVVILSQYLRSMDKYRVDHSQRGQIHMHEFYWNVEGAVEEYLAKRPKQFA